jgi:hypothetical protein
MRNEEGRYIILFVTLTGVMFLSVNYILGIVDDTLNYCMDYAFDKNNVNVCLVRKDL